MDEKSRGLIFLAHLTLAGIKPLRRVEWDLAAEEMQYLTDLDLHVQRVTRSTLGGGPIVQVVFSRNETTLVEYLRCFEGTSLEKTPEIIRQEGRFFGFPSCCVESFIRTGGEQLPNGLAPEDQGILYHWVCPSCRVTPELVAQYRRVWRKI